MKSFFSLLLVMGLWLTSSAQERMTAAQYIAGFKDIAMSEMRRTGIPASIKLAQGLLEAEMGNSNLVRRSNNHFGIKCKADWLGESVSHDDDERGECFRKYDNPEDSYRDHSEFLRSRERYASLFKLRPDDYKGWAYGLKKAGYATNPRYPQMLIYNIEKYNLQQYDEVVLNTPDDKLAEENMLVDVSEETEEAPISLAKSEIISQADYKTKTRRNGLSAVFAPKGTSLLAIATVHNIALTRLLEYNDLKKDGMLEDDAWIYLERKNKESSQARHQVVEGETLFDIAQSHGVQLSRLVDYNNKPPMEVLPTGTFVHLKPVPMDDLAAAGKVKTGKFIHEVAPKEGLYAISKKYNVSVQDIKNWNNLTSDQLTVGQQLIISKQ